MEKPDPEILLLHRTAHGDCGSFDQLYERFSGVLFSTALNVLGNQESAEDVLQEVFVAIWEKAPLYDSERGKPITWAVTMARHKAIDRLRSIQRKGALYDRLEQEPATIDEPRNALDEVDSAEMSRIVHAALLQISRTQREAIELAYFSGLTHAEVAGHLHCPLGTVKARIRRGILKLRQIISNELPHIAADDFAGGF